MDKCQILIKKMKKTWLYLFLLLYVSSVMKPIMPIVSDWVAHTFWHLHHLQTVHHHHGHSHSHAQLVQAVEEEKKTSSTNSNTQQEKKEDPVFLENLSPTQTIFHSFGSQKKREYPIFNCLLSSPPSELLTPPPQV